MLRPQDELLPFCIESVCAVDRAAGKAFIRIDVGRDSTGRVVPSLARLQRKVEKYLNTTKKPVSTATKLYITGDWVTAEPDAEQTKDQKILGDAKEWDDGVDAVCKLIRAMGKLKELVWIGGLPFMTTVLDRLPQNMTKLVLNLGNHVCVRDNRAHLTILHLNPEEMEPLTKQTRLQELRLFNMRDSMQLIAWRIVYENQNPEGMQLLELEMATEPILRNNNNNKYHKAVNVRGFTVAQPGLLEKPYKGRNGKGGLHWSFGYGEYLDSDCIRKARIATGVEEPQPLPLQSLRLDGFVIDHLPFEKELQDISLLVCGEKCIDAGMRAPRSHAKPYYAWSSQVNNVACQFHVRWPNWSGFFDSKGDQRNTRGEIVAQEAGLSTPYIECAPALHVRLRPLAEKAVNQKDIGEATINASKLDCFNIRPSSPSPIVPDSSTGVVSDVSECGTEVPALIELPDVTVDEAIALRGSVPFTASSQGSSDIVSVNGSGESPPDISPTSSFGSDGSAPKHKARRSLTDSYWVVGPS